MKKIISIMTVLVIVLAMATVSNAAITEKTAKLNVSVSKSQVKVGDEVTVTVSWKDKMEAIDLELGFDKNKVEYVSSSMSEDYIATDRIADGVVQISWFSMNGQGKNSITYTFKAKANGDATFTTAEAILADENVESPEDYTYGKATLKIGTAEEEKPETNTEKPSTNTEKPETNTEEPAQNTQKPANTEKPTTNTNKPTKIPQAGVNVVSYVIYGLVAVAVITLGACIIRAKRK